jgi:CxxC-x17-CxxC domain-containing protein
MMSKKTKTKSRGPVPQVDPYLDGLMAKLMDRLGALERKMDTVIAHTTANRPSDRSPQSGPGSFSQGPRPAQAQQVFSRPNAPLEPKHPSRHERTMYEAVCADCSDPCEVPFRPSPERAIYCKPCFAKRRAEGRVHPQGQPQRPQGPQVSSRGPQGPGGSSPSAVVLTAGAPKAADKTKLADAKAQQPSKKSKPAAAKPAKSPSASSKKAKKK